MLLNKKDYYTGHRFLLTWIFIVQNACQTIFLQIGFQFICLCLKLTLTRGRGNLTRSSGSDTIYMSVVSKVKSPTWSSSPELTITQLANRHLKLSMSDAEVLIHTLHPPFQHLHFLALLVALNKKVILDLSFLSLSCNLSSLFILPPKTYPCSICFHFP